MLRNSFFIVAVLFSLVVKAEISDPQGVFKEANKLYEDQQYEAARDQYLLLTDDELYSAELFRNLGNTFYRLGDIPNAVLYYEKALKLSPGDEDIIHNLELTNLKVADKNNIAKSVRMDDWLFSLISRAPNYWAKNAIYLFIIGFALLSLFLFASTIRMKKASFYTGLTALTFGIICVLLAGFHKSKLSTVNEAIIFEPSIELMTEPTENASTAFVLHQGSKVALTGQNELWYEVKFGDGKIGWLKKEAVKEI